MNVEITINNTAIEVLQDIRKAMPPTDYWDVDALGVYITIQEDILPPDSVQQILQNHEPTEIAAYEKEDGRHTTCYSYEF